MFKKLVITNLLHCLSSIIFCLVFLLLQHLCLTILLLYVNYELGKVRQWVNCCSYSGHFFVELEFAVSANILLFDRLHM